jgi:hypothetical protein
MRERRSIDKMSARVCGDILILSVGVSWRGDRGGGVQISSLYTSTLLLFHVSQKGKVPSLPHSLPSLIIE